MKLSPLAVSLALMLGGALTLAQAAVADGPAGGEEVVYEADFRDGQAHGWKPTHNLAPFTFDRGYLSNRALGDDAFMVVSGLQIPTSRISHVVFRLRSDRAGATQVYFSTTDSPNPAAHPVPQVACRGDGQWHEYEVRLVGLKGFTGTLTMLRLDPVNGGGESAHIDLAWVRLVRKPPRLVVTEVSCSQPLIEPGQKAQLTLQVTNYGGPARQALQLRLQSSSQLGLAHPVQKLTFGTDEVAAKVSWPVTALRPGPGVLRLTAAGQQAQRLLVKAIMPVVAGLDRPTATPSPRREIGNGLLRLTFLPGDDGVVVAGVLQVKDGRRWKKVALLSPLAELAYTAEGQEIWRQMSFPEFAVKGSVATLTARTPDATVIL
ncbi:MAG: hypothetical protein J7M26_08415, partial [Armatimonadetes bacterium]|nr:hypothetical protein [Armatimonadota bacterium]